MSILQQIKYTLIRLQSFLQQRTIVTFVDGKSYVIAGNTIKCLGGPKK